jgi:hypothetical protein
MLSKTKFKILSMRSASTEHVFKRPLVTNNTAVKLVWNKFVPTARFWSMPTFKKVSW